MDVDLTIRYSDHRLCEIVASRPDTAAPLYQIVSRRTDLSASLTESMRELRRLFANEPWPDRHRHLSGLHQAWRAVDSHDCVTQLAQKLSANANRCIGCDAFHQEMLGPVP